MSAISGMAAASVARELAAEIAALVAERDELRGALSWIAHTFTEDSHGNMKTLPASDYQKHAIAALERKKEKK